MHIRNRHFLTPLAAAGLLALAACGGGGDNSPPPPPAPTPLTVGGTAATGAALSGATVSVQCAEGEGSITTMPSGSYSVTIADATAPCLVRVVSSDMMTTYYSLVAAGSASPATVNLTPLTTLLTTQVLGADPADAFDDFDSAARALLTPAAVTAARDDITASLAGQVDLSGINPITTPFVVGDATDQLLDDFGAVLEAAQLTLPELAAALLANPGVPDAVRTVLAPAGSSCPSLRSGPIVLVSLGGFSTATVDSAALTTTFDDGAFPPLTMTDLGNCEFSTSVGGAFTVSPSSLTISRFPAGGGNFSMSFGFPSQQIPLSELAGNWSVVFYISKDGGPFTPGHGSFTLDGAGRYTGNYVGCTGFNTCETEPASPTDVLTVVAPEAGGGFVEGGTLNRAFAYRADNGTTMLVVAIDAQDGFDEVGFAVATKQTTLALPTVGAATPFSQFAINGSGFAGAFSSDVSTVTAVSASGGGSFTRSTLNGVTQTFQLNSPRSGMRFRAAGSSPDSGGTPVSFPATVQLPTGAGVVLGISAAEGQNFFNAAVTTPAPAAP